MKRNTTKAKDCIDAPVMLFKGKKWIILKVIPMIHGFTGLVFAYEFHIKDNNNNFDIRICNKNQLLKIPDY